MAEQKTPRIAILGAGMSGMAMAIQLKRAGIDSFTIYEKASEVGGTWRDNIYPGIACDVPSHLYSFSFELNPGWTRSFSPGSEIQSYCCRVADKYDLRRAIKFNHRVEAAEYHNGGWRLTIEAGGEKKQAEADILVSAMGGLHEPALPALPGQEKFAGPSFHSARWDENIDLKGKKVLLIGSAASAVQITPEIAPHVARLTVFQRTANWVVPRDDRPYSRRWQWALRFIPGLARLYRWWIYFMLEARFPLFLQRARLTGFFSRIIRATHAAHMEKSIKDKALQKALTPNYPPGCKRLLISDTYFAGLARDNVDLVTDPIAAIEEAGVRTQSGRLYPGDVLVYATGFHPFNLMTSFHLTGRGGAQLDDVWRNGITSHRTLALAGFPNFFMLLGPNSGLGHNSVVIMIEIQVDYIIACIRRMIQKGWQSIEPKAQALEVFDKRLHEQMKDTVWQTNCQSWYKDANGRVFTLWPRGTINYWRSLRKPDFSEYSIR